MRERKPEDRIKDFKEVPLGYSVQEALKEASRCLDCKSKPCVKGCPAEVDIPGFIRAIKSERFAEALDLIKKTNAFPAVCGRVCPQEDQCEEKCVLGAKGKPIDIGGLERFVADFMLSNSSAGGKEKKIQRALSVKPKKIAVIGSGPAGLTCAADLVKLGWDVTIFEALHEPGGVLTYGIPEFRLPKDIVREEVKQIEALGARIRYNYIIGKTKSIEDLKRDGFEVIFISTGAGLPYFLGIKGENLNGVYSANEFLVRVNLMKAYKFPEYDTPVTVGRKVAVIGGGNVAMDAARSALRLEAKKVHVIYRRSREQMPARVDEIHHAEQEGISFEFLASPLELLGDQNNNVRSVRCIRNRLGEPDQSGRRRPEPIEGEEFEIDVDSLIVAIGNGPNPLLPKTTENLALGKWGNIEADMLGRTSREDVFAGGDIVTGAATVIAAMGAGKKAARAIDKKLRCDTL